MMFLLLFVSSLIFRSAGTSCVLSLYDYRGLYVLFSCLDVTGEVADAAAIALMLSVTKERDMWDRGEVEKRLIPTSIGNKVLMAKTLIPIESLATLPHYAGNLASFDSLVVHSYPLDTLFLFYFNHAVDVDVVVVVVVRYKWPCVK